MPITLPLQCWLVKQAKSSVRIEDPLYVKLEGTFRNTAKMMITAYRELEYYRLHPSPHQDGGMLAGTRIGPLAHLKELRWLLTLFGDFCGWIARNVLNPKEVILRPRYEVP